jgi:ribosomal protein L11 methyltransferase
MPFLELHLRLRAIEQPQVEAAIEALGSLAITLLDAEDMPILEPGVGETPLWPELTLTALFPAEFDKLDLLVALDGAIPEPILRSAKFAMLDDKDWTRAWMDCYQPMQFGKRLWIVPTTHTPPDPTAVNIRLDPGLAFGTGTHPTTALCLSWLDGLDLRGKTVLDFGCGSGILAIAALKLGAAHAYGVDNDPQALIASQDNAHRNGVMDRFTVLSDRDPAPPSCDVLVANILLPPLLSLKTLFAKSCKAGAPVAFSGMLAGQERELIPAYQGLFESLETVQQDDWIRVAGRRSANQ